METNKEIKVKVIMFRAWQEQLSYLRSRSKCKDYGTDSTIEQLWNILPEVSKQHWLEQEA